ncbi:L-aspartate oxidase [Dermatobacter hominis]|uniref:L-aspartate oxidase n=1 Tax=Dermatobacter hominis TaxID=2884263 RepID=UPI001D1083B7|nr:FAD-binding protein [Dermatobacter hominis]UDY34452.1 FAD-binding protein [Dermatobacter hominis]
MSDELDLLVLGSGVAGLSAAVRAASEHGLRTGVLTKGLLEQTTTRWAQGGVAAALTGDAEEVDLHLADTLAAGAGLCDLDAVRVLVDEGPRRVEELIGLGAEFDRDERGNLDLAREGGHSVARVVHAGSATGAEVERALVAAVRSTAAAVLEHTFAHDLILEDGRCVGVRAHGPDGPTEVRTRHLLLATGGAGQLFAVTTNPPEATGDGVAMALRAGVAIADLEFFQFHPTALALPSMPRPLLSEALRGHGALLRDRDGERFVDELLPRDVVSRAILAKMLEQGTDHVWLDATGLDHFDARFPNIAASLAAAGLDASVDLLPVAPAAHHQCGGIVTDLSGATTLPGLWGAGETTCTGVHGANRLASNSLLEGMVFGPRAVEAIAAGVDGPSATGAMRCVLGFPGEEPDEDSLDIPGVPLAVPPPPAAGPAGADGAGADGATPLDAAAVRAEVQHAMSMWAGVVRSEGGLAECAALLDRTVAALPDRPTDAATAEVRNLAEIGRVLVAAARARTESRGTHARLDFPEIDPAQRHRQVVGGP